MTVSSTSLPVNLHSYGTRRTTILMSSPSDSVLKAKKHGTASMPRTRRLRTRTKSCVKAMDGLRPTPTPNLILLISLSTTAPLSPMILAVAGSLAARITAGRSHKALPAIWKYIRQASSDSSGQIVSVKTCSWRRSRWTKKKSSAQQSQTKL